MTHYLPFNQSEIEVDSGLGPVQIYSVEDLDFYPEPLVFEKALSLSF